MTKLQDTGERLIPGGLGKTACEHLHRYAFCFKFVKGKKVLDIASGEGYGSNLLAKYAAQVIGVDISAEAVSHAQKTYPRPNLSFQVGSVLDIPFPSETFDLVVSFETIEHISDHQRMISEVKRVLKPNGILIISTPEKSVYSDEANYSNPYHEKELYESEFLELLSRQFQSFQIGYQKFLKGSFIFPAHHKGEELAFYRGGFQEIVNYDSINQEYLIAVCSNSQLDSLSVSIFDSRELEQYELEEQILLRIKKLKSGFRYRLADFLFKPWDLLKGFKNK